ncbi:MAG: dihydropteroate synthase [Actinomycetota bacterium]|nr:dihydropteroate synthase [Actinomycetota bacterium]
MNLRCGRFVLDLRRVAVMGVLNVTPDSFSDGGSYFDHALALDRARQMVAEGAAIIDVGGESTRPGAAPVSMSEETRRVLPVIEALAPELDVPVSVDTRKAQVARSAVAAGASIINDTGGEDATEDLTATAAATGPDGVAMVVMHSRGTSETMTSLTAYDDLVGQVAGYLGRRAESLKAAGVSADRIVIDPGIGFAKTAGQSLELLKRIGEFADLGFPLLAGTSRKSLIGAVLDVPADRRVSGTAATVAWAVAHGVHIVRVHDIEAMTQVVHMTEAIKAGGTSG